MVSKALCGTLWTVRTLPCGRWTSGSRPVSLSAACGDGFWCECFCTFPFPRFFVYVPVVLGSRGTFCPMHRLPQAVLGGVNEGSVRGCVGPEACCHPHQRPNCYAWAMPGWTDTGPSRTHLKCSEVLCFGFWHHKFLMKGLALAQMSLLVQISFWLLGSSWDVVSLFAAKENFCLPSSIPLSVLADFLKYFSCEEKVICFFDFSRFLLLDAADMMLALSGAIVNNNLSCR